MRHLRRRKPRPGRKAVAAASALAAPGGRVPDTAVTGITEADLGLAVSYQCCGMARPEHGVVSGVAEVPKASFVKFDGEARGKLCHWNTLRWGCVRSWWGQRSDGAYEVTRPPKAAPGDAV